jgi:hypothetical protein
MLHVSPKDKAIEVFNDFYIESNCSESITATLVFKAVDIVRDHCEFAQDWVAVKYWEDVRQELKKLL